MAEPKACNKKMEGKVAIITGGASGIGAATARLFADHGARAVVIADVQDEKGEELAASIEKSSHCASACTYFHCDVTKEQEVESLVQTTIQLYGGLDVMFCNAGIMSKSLQTLLDFDLSSCQNLFAVNVGGVAACVKHAGRAMAEAGTKGSIICMASVAAGVGSDRHTDYVMSKSAVLALMKCAAAQLGEHGIRVNCVSPGPVATPMLCEAFGMGVEEAEASFGRLCRLKGEGALKVKHVADGVLFLASDESRFVTAHNLVVDGGFRPS